MFCQFSMRALFYSVPATAPVGAIEQIESLPIDFIRLGIDIDIAANGEGLRWSAPTKKSSQSG